MTQIALRAYSSIVLLAFAWAVSAVGQTIAPHLSADLEVVNIGSQIFVGANAQSRTTQLALAPGPSASTRYIYMSSAERGIRRVTYDITNNTLVAGSLQTVAGDIRGLGIAFHGNTLYASEPYASSASSNRLLSRLWRIEDMGFGTRTAIVEGIPRDDHGLNNIQILGNTLYVGNGTRTRNGAFSTFGGDAYGESAYGGAILTIDDLTQVPSTSNSAGFFPANPTTTEYRNVIDGTDPIGGSPFSSTAPNKLRVHSSGTRNPYGMAIDGDGNVWFTNNWQRTENHVYDRANLTSAEPDQFGGDGFQDDIHDQFFQAVEKGDYGYRNGNWQDGNVPGNTAATGAGFFQASQRQPSFTFDNYIDPVASGETDGSHPAYNTDHDVANPAGLGPSSSANGFDFYQANSFPLRLHKDAFISRWNGTISDGGDNLTYRDVVGVDVATGQVQRVASGFNNPLDVQSDGQGNLLVADYGGSLFLIRARNPHTSAHVFNWDSVANGNWSDRLTWNANSLAAADRLVPHAWGTAQYTVVINRTDAQPRVTLDQRATVESIILGNELHVAADHQLTVQDRLNVLTSGTLSGSGIIDGTIENNGRTQPGDSAGDSTANLSVHSYHQNNSGRLEMNIGGTSFGSHDRLSVTTDAMLAGQLSLSIVPGYVPVLGDEVTLMTFGSDNGIFDSVEGIMIDATRAFAVTYLAGEVRARVARLGDINFDNAVDAADAAIMFNFWGQSANSWSTGDINGDGTVDAADAGQMFGAWTGDMAPQSVPEPIAASLFAMVVAAACLARRRSTS